MTKKKTHVEKQQNKNGELADLLRRKEEELNRTLHQKVKIIERNGTRLEHTLCKSDPWGDQDCERPDCLVCSSRGDTDKGPSCRATNILYRVSCKICKDQGKQADYWGESSRSGYRRGLGIIKETQ